MGGGVGVVVKYSSCVNGKIMKTEVSICKY